MTTLVQAADYGTLTAAVDATPEGGTLHLSAGVYSIDEPIVRLTPITITGDHDATTISVELDSEHDALTIGNPQATGYGGGLRNLRFVGPSGCCRSVVVYRRAPLITIRDVTICAGGAAYGLDVQGTVGAVVDNLQIGYTYGAGGGWSRPHHGLRLLGVPDDPQTTPSEAYQSNGVTLRVFISALAGDGVQLDGSAVNLTSIRILQSVIEACGGYLVRAANVRYLTIDQLEIEQPTNGIELTGCYLPRLTSISGLTQAMGVELVGCELAHLDSCGLGYVSNQPTSDRGTCRLEDCDFAAPQPLRGVLISGQRVWRYGDPISVTGAGDSVITSTRYEFTAPNPAAAIVTDTPGGFSVECTSDITMRCVAELIQPFAGRRLLFKARILVTEGGTAVRPYLSLTVVSAGGTINTDSQRMVRLDDGVLGVWRDVYCSIVVPAEGVTAIRADILGTGKFEVAGIWLGEGVVV